VCTVLDWRFWASICLHLGLRRWPVLSHHPPDVYGLICFSLSLSLSLSGAWLPRGRATMGVLQKRKEIRKLKGKAGVWSVRSSFASELICLKGFRVSAPHVKLHNPTAPSICYGRITGQAHRPPVVRVGPSAHNTGRQGGADFHRPF
jgi:hypothetical protein